MRLKDLRAKRAKITADLRELANNPGGDGGDLSAEQQTRFDELRAEIETTDAPSPAPNIWTTRSAAPRERRLAAGISRAMALSRICVGRSRSARRSRTPLPARPDSVSTPAGSMK